jgi:SAM-dependent methyltransferase
MDPDYENQRRRLEADYWLFRARRELVLSLIESYRLEKTARILDLGCGGGYLVEFLGEIGFADIYGIDLSGETVRQCRERGALRILPGDCSRTPFGGDGFDAIIAADVLEHLEKPVEALQEWRRILRAEGRLFITVPAFSFLWSRHDEVCHHYRRYTRFALRASLEEADFEVERISFWNTALFFPVCLIRMAQKLFRNRVGEPGKQLFEPRPWINAILYQLLSAENKILGRVNLPVGISICAVARKRE